MGNNTGKRREVLLIDQKMTKLCQIQRTSKKSNTEKQLKNMKDLYMINNCNSFVKQEKMPYDDINTKFGALKFEENDSKDCLENYILLKTIGKGNFGKVLLVKSRVDGQFYALKVLKKVDIIKSQYIDRIKTEKRVLEKIKHPFIIKLFSTFQSTEKIFFLTELCNGGELFFHLQRKKRFSENCVKFYGAQLYLALSFLHSNGIIYRDIKPENIMFEKEGNIKLIDMGMVKDKFISHDLKNTVCGTSEYLRILF